MLWAARSVFSISVICASPDVRITGLYAYSRSTGCFQADTSIPYHDGNLSDASTMAVELAVRRQIHTRVPSEYAAVTDFRRVESSHRCDISLLLKAHCGHQRDVKDVESRR